jgi:predicted Zn finger-like uncharacterized protein
MATAGAKTIVECGNCRARYRAPADQIGKVARCPRCRHRFVLSPKRTLDDTVLDWLLDDRARDEDDQEDGIVTHDQGG